MYRVNVKGCSRVGIKSTLEYIYLSYGKKKYILKTILYEITLIREY